MEELIDKFLIDVDTVQVVLDSEYFIKKFVMATENRLIDQ